MYTWKEELCTGHDEVDKQHRKLFQVCARIEKNLQNGDQDVARRTVIEGVKYLKEYTCLHFTTEEKLQLSLNYEDYENHKSIHDSFKKQIAEYEKQLEQCNYCRESVDELLTIVTKWLFNHIMGMDQKIPKTSYNA